MRRKATDYQGMAERIEALGGRFPGCRRWRITLSAEIPWKEFAMLDSKAPAAPIRVAIADDQDLVRKGFRLHPFVVSRHRSGGRGGVDGSDAVALARR